ncbi:MAG: nucleotidyl transferase AbiEii/AbiGii toxin family protein [Candidatus Marinimicrobia bacterium]|nr:nucleotidyl transferase AbiEii/AbiGii toxin family protein [Candidatus Neomarinimicrobiota bacterium]
MDIFRTHEQFELDVLNGLNSARILPGLILGGGTMLRLCHGLDRYSVDLDFYLVKSDFGVGLLEKCVKALGRRLTIMDHQDKRNTILIELSSVHYPRKLKIEVNKVRSIKTWKPEIAWSPFSNMQVLVNAVTLSEMAEMKIDALINRKEIRDAYDLEFLLKKKAPIPGDKDRYREILERLNGFTHQDFAVKLGSIIEAEKRQYYIENRFAVLKTYLLDMIANAQT